MFTQPFTKKLALVICAIALTVTLTKATEARIKLGVKWGEADIHIGCLYPMTGRGGSYGRDSLVGIELALEELQGQHLAAVPKLRIIVEDTKSSRFRGIQLAKELVRSDRIDFLCGVVSSDVALAVSKVALRSNIFFIGTDHASPRLTGDALHPLYFRVSNDSKQSMRAGAAYIKKKYGHRETPIKIAFIGPDYDYGYRQWADLRTFLKKEQIPFEVTEVLWPKLFEADFTPYIRALSRDSADIIINGHWGGDLIAFIRQAKDFGLFSKKKFMNFDAGGNYEVLAALKSEMPLGLVLSARHHVNWPDTIKNKSFVRRFFQLTGRYPSYAAEGAYAGIMAISQAYIVAGGTLNQKAIIKALETITLNLPEDPSGFNSFMDPKTHQIQQVQAIGETVRAPGYPPAEVLLGNWYIYSPIKGHIASNRR